MLDGETRSLRVGVLVDLERCDTAGGHVKCWERIAEAAARLDVPLDLTIHVQGDKAETQELAANVRFVARRPLLSSGRWRALDVGADHTDLAPIHPGLLRDLVRYDVIHTTDAYFAYARTAHLAARLWNKPLVTSIHTDTPSYTRLYAERVLRRLCGNQRLANWLINKRRLPEKFANGMLRKLGRHMQRADWTLVGAQPEEATGSHHISVLRRGVDTVHFTPARRNRHRLAEIHGIAPQTKVALFVGRLDDGKGVRLFTSALKRLVDAGEDVVGIFAGRGKERDWIAGQLGDRAILLGQVDRDRLADVYASADLFVFPSEIEISPNVVIEAQASGLASLVAPGGGGRFVAQHGLDGLVIDSREPHAWARQIAAILSDDARRVAMGIAARMEVERRHPSWEQVVLEDLYPIWRRSVAQRKGHTENYVSAAPAYSRSAS
jgi:glycosyltransferase involved in cell wall biosynthesis